MAVAKPTIRRSTPTSPMTAGSSSGKQPTSLLVGVMLPIFGLLASLATSLWAGSLDSARQLYQRTAYEAALSSLGAEGSQDALVLLLAGQIYYQLGKYQEASEQLKKASELQSGSAEIFLWLGRSLGRQAEAASIFTAPGYARRCREALEQSRGPERKAPGSDERSGHLLFGGSGVSRRWPGKGRAAGIADCGAGRGGGALCTGTDCGEKGRISQVPRHTSSRLRRWHRGRSIGCSTWRSF